MSEQKAEFIYTTYIRTTPQKVWDAITNPEFCRQYWGYGLVSDFKPGSKWDMVGDDGRIQTTGEVLESQAPTRLVLSWVKPDNRADRSEYSRVVFEIETRGDAVRLNVLHDQLKPGSPMFIGISDGWPRVIAGLKSFLETGKGLLLMCQSNGQSSSQAKVA